MKLADRISLRSRRPGRLRLPAGGAGLRRILAALQPAARTSVLLHRPTHRERRAWTAGRPVFGP